MAGEGKREIPPRFEALVPRKGALACDGSCAQQYSNGQGLSVVLFPFFSTGGKH